MAKAILKNYRQSPRKVRLVANTVRGQKVSKALVNLSFVPKRAAEPLKKLIESAVANATNNSDVKLEDLVVKSIQELSKENTELKDLKISCDLETIRTKYTEICLFLLILYQNIKKCPKILSPKCNGEE